MSRVFIDRPIFAWVLAIVVMLAGIAGIRGLPVEQYPDIAPPQVNIRASYPGASAETIENSVTQILEQQLTGIDGLLYFSSTSSSRGQVNISAIFEKGTDPDTAQVQVQNQVQQAISRLPAQVQQQGVRVTKSNPDFLLIVGIYDETDQRTNMDISDYLSSNLQDPLSRVPGVGDINVFGAPHAMRIWLNPQRLAAFQLMPGDVISAISAQNTEVAAGEVGGLPSPQGQMLNATVTAQSKLQTPEQFREIILKTDTSGASVRLGDVARVELGAENYSSVVRINGHPGAGIAISLAPGADALETAELVKARVQQLSENFPEGLTFAYANDTTEFIKLSVDEVVKTLIEAIILVILVIFVFLQNWRALMVPAIAIPVVLLGTFAVFYMTGFTINTLTLFGLTLAVGLLVDDAIVVVENVERLLHENPDMTPREATIESMKEIQVALVAIALVLSAVFLPMAFFGGSTGVIYQQFSITIIAAMALSVLVALIFSPALTSTLLKQRSKDPEGPNWLDRKVPALGRVIRSGRDKFNSGFDWTVTHYRSATVAIIERKWLALGIYGLVVAALIVMFLRLPTGFLPTEDQGAASIQFRLPPGATQGRTLEVRDEIERYLTEKEGENIKTLFLVAGGGGGGGAVGQNTGQGFVNFVHWDERSGKENTADAIVERASGAFRGFRDAQVFALVPGAIRGLGQSSGFTMQFQNRSGMSREQFLAARDRLLQEANGNPKLTSVRISDLPDVATYKIDVNQQKLTALGLNQTDINNTLSTAWGGRYVNDFIDKGRVKRVYVQADAPYRADPSSLGQWYVRSSSGEMTPFSSFAQTGWATAPSSLSRFQGVPAFEFQGQPAAGVSSGEAMDEMERLASEVEGTSVAWSGQSYQERLSSGQAPLLYAISLLVVFLCLAALYESWSIPLAVLLVIPLGLVGAIFAVTLRGLENDVYLQIGLLTTMGLAAKNAILMIEFAEQGERKGMRIIDAALEAARIRLRPILMTSFAFIFGVLPLALSTGAGANSRIAIGTSVIGGMLTATILAIFYIPLFFVLVRRGVRDGLVVIRERLSRRREATRVRKAVLALALAATGCTSLQPAYVRPNPSIPASWPAGDPYLRQSEASLPAVTYRDIFRDPRLQRLIEQALVNNRDVAVAAANIAAAREQVRIQRASQFPQVDASAGGSATSRETTNADGSTSRDITTSYNLGVSPSFEIDLFGRLRSLTDVERNRYFATEAASRAVRLALVADIANAWLTYAADASLLRIAEDTVTSAARSERLTRLRLEGGIAPRTDLRQAQQILEAARADAADQRTALAQDVNLLQLLVGAPVDRTLLPASIDEAAPQIAELPAGLSSYVLLRRPDVVQAEYELRAANAQIGAARAVLFPRISLTGLLGVASTALTSLFSGSAFQATVGADASYTIFNAGAGRANVRQTEAQRQAAVASYQRTIQTAFREVSDALARRGTTGELIRAREASRAAAADTYLLTEARYRNGIDNFLASLDAQRSYYAAQRTLVVARLTAATNLVDLYEALGGDSLLTQPAIQPL